MGLRIGLELEGDRRKNGVSYGAVGHYWEGIHRKMVNGGLAPFFFREALTIHKDLARKLEALEKKVGSHDAQFQAVFDRLVYVPGFSRELAVHLA